MSIHDPVQLEFVYAIVPNNYLGYIIEPHLVEITKAGNFSLVSQRLFYANAQRYKSYLTDNDIEVLKLIENLNLEHIVKKFGGKFKHLRPKEFFEKKCDQTVYKLQIVPYVERNLAIILQTIEGQNLYFAAETKNPTHIHLNKINNKAQVNFYFRRTETDTRYFAIIHSEGQSIKLFQEQNIFLTHTPPIIISNDKLIWVDDAIDGKKLEPFFSKSHISIARRTEDQFFKVFGKDLIEKFNVKSEGFEIIEETYKAQAVLKLEYLIDNNIGFILSFKYGNETFSYHSLKRSHVIYKNVDDKITFIKIKRSKEWEERKKELLESLGLKNIQGSIFTIPNQTKSEILQWLEHNINILDEKHFEIVQDLGNEKYFLGEKNIKVEILENGDWFDINAIVTFGQYQFPFLALKKYIISGNKEFKLPDGTIAILPDAWFEQFKIIVQSCNDDNMRISKMQWGLLGHIATTKNIEAKKAELSSFEKIEDMNEPSHFKGILRNYQKSGYNWFHFLNKYQFGGILADDMGLGKTIQTLALLQYFKEHQSNTHFVDIKNVNQGEKQLSLFDTNQKEVSINKTSLLIAPTSLLYNWEKEASTFTPDINIYIHTGQNRKKDAAHFFEYDLVITSYGTLRNDEKLFIDFEFFYIILDESQYIKNPQSQISLAVKNLRAKNKIVLTGTPIENSLRDLWSQMTFVNPGLLGGLKFFEDTYVTPIEKNNDEHVLNLLKNLINPFILRRTKKQVATELPEKTELVQYCEMTTEQANLYEETKSKYRNLILNIDETTKAKNNIQIIAGLTKLRQIANHPLLVDNAFEGNSGKFEQVLEKLNIAINSGHKILIYSQFVKQLTIFKKYFDQQKLEYCYFDGSYKSELRQQQVEEFQTNENKRIFLVSLKAGGVGITLTAADYVFILDPWWNPAIEQQAVDRTHRIGQTKSVFCYKFISKNTVEEKILMLQSHKKQLADHIIQQEDSFYKNLSIDDLKSIFN